MKYDFTRCNNLNFKVKEEGVEKTGYLKISSEGKVDMFYSDGEKILDPAVQIDVTVRGIHFINIESFSRWVERHDFEIVPRDPETYTDWKAGDEVIDNEGDTICIIIVRLGELVFIKNPYEKIKTMTSAWVDANYKLIVTDYEKELLNTKEQDTCPFKIGDRVLVRDDNEGTWVFGIFDSYRGGNEYPYKCEFECYRQCIPYNENTWQLLGTTGEYKEE